MLALFKKYVLVGVVNTSVHWGVFFIVVSGLGFNQGVGNLLAFLVAVSFSYYLNARYTFKKNLHYQGYVFFVAFMGGLSFIIGISADYLNLPPVLTLIAFSALSLILGFFYSRFFVFK